MLMCGTPVCLCVFLVPCMSGVDALVCLCVLLIVCVCMITFVCVGMWVCGMFMCNILGACVSGVRFSVYV